MKNNIIEISNLTVCYEKHKAIDDLSLHIRSGEVLGLLGENGAGKSTLINTILGRIKPHSGQVSVFSHAPGSYAAKLKIGTILQSANLPDNTTVEEQINLFRSYYQNPMELSNILKITLLEDLRKRKINSLSGGQKQRVFFALAICGQPEMIFLDEPTVGLDIGARREFWRCIEQLKQDGVAMVLTTHYLEEAEALSDSIVLLNRGRIVNQGSPEEIKAQALGKQVQFNWNNKTQTFSDFIHSNGIAELINSATPQIHCEKDKVSFISGEPEAALKVLFAKDANISNLTVESTKLEDAVMALNQAEDPHEQDLHEKSPQEKNTQEKAA